MMSARSTADRRVHDWFLSRGLPLVLRRRVRVRNLIERAAPVIAGFGAGLVGHDIAVWLTERPVGVGFPAGAAAVGAVLGISALGLPALRRLGGRVWHGAAWAVIGLFVVALPLVAADEGWKVAGIPEALAVAAAVVGLTYLGVGSIVLWALKFAAIQVGAMITLMSRALPLLMLTVMIFFTNEIWQLMAAMSGDRFWWTTGFLAAVAVAFMVATIRDEVRALRESRSAKPRQRRDAGWDTVGNGHRTGAHAAVARRTGQRRGGDGDGAGHSGGVVHLGPVGVLPGAVGDRGARRADGGLVG
jgi:hypothetical protein